MTKTQTVETLQNWQKVEWNYAFLDINQYLWYQEETQTWVFINTKQWQKYFTKTQRYQSVAEVISPQQFLKWQIDSRLGATERLALRHTTSGQVIHFALRKGVVVLASYFAQHQDAPQDFKQDLCQILNEILKT